MRIDFGITIGQMVDELELFAKVTSREDWWNKIAYLPLG
jgi:hypothetical protein